MSKKQVLIINITLSLLSLIIGLYLVYKFSNVWVAVGLFLAIWGNNLTQKHLKNDYLAEKDNQAELSKEIVKQLKEINAKASDNNVY